MSDITTLSPFEIDSALAALDNDYNKILARRDGITYSLRRVDGQNGHFEGRKRVFSSSVEKTVESVERKLAEGKIAPYEVEGARRDLANLIAIEVEAEKNRAACEPYDTEYRRRPWPRYFQVVGGKIHSGMWCQGGSIRWTTLRGWQPELSGHTVEEAVAKLGSNLCSKCFPTAPAAAKPDPVAEGYCAGSGQFYVEGTRKHRYPSGIGECPVCHEYQTLTSTGKVRRHKA